MNKFDYSVIAVPPTFEQAKKIVPSVPRFYKNAVFAFVLLIVIMTVQFVIIASDYVWRMVPFVATPIIIAAAYYYWRYRQEIRRIAGMRIFAEANDMESFYNHYLKDTYPGSLFNDGHSRYIAMAFRTKGQDETLEVGNYRYVIGHGRGARTHIFTYMMIQLDKEVPHIFIDSKDNNRNRLFYRNHAGDYAKSQKLSFEGDFDTHFSVLVPDDYGRDAKYILTPDVLHALIEYGKEYDFELMGNTLIMFKHGFADLSDAKTLETMLSKATRFASEFRKQTKYYVDERAAQGEVQSIGEKGQKLRTAFPWFFALLMAYLLAAFLVDRFNSLP